MKRAIVISIASLFIVNSAYAVDNLSGGGTVILDFPAPVAVSFHFACNSVDLEWQSPSGATPDGYNVYRKVGQAGNWLMRNSGLIIDTSFADNDIILEEDFQYCVTAIYGNIESDRVELEPQYLPDPSTLDYLLVGTGSTESLNYWYKSILDNFGLQGEIVSDILPYCGDLLADLPLLWVVDYPYRQVPWNELADRDFAMIDYLQNNGNVYIEDFYLTCVDTLMLNYLFYGITTCISYPFMGVDGVAGTFAEGLSFSLRDTMWSSNIVPGLDPPEGGIVLEDNVACGCVDLYVDRQGYKAIVNSQSIYEFLDGPNGTRVEYFQRMMEFFGIQTGIEESDNIVKPEKMLILQAYPNPFNAQISLNIASSAINDITIEIFDITGRLIKRFENVNSNIPVIWDGRNEGGQPVSSGVYFARAGGANGPTSSAKLTLMK